MPDSDELRKLAAWYREFAERTDNPAIWVRGCARPKSWKPTPTVSHRNPLPSAGRIRRDHGLTCRTCRRPTSRRRGGSRSVSAGMSSSSLPTTLAALNRY